jgi:hypothetical protein
MDNAPEEKIAVEVKPIVPPLAHAGPRNKHSDKRMANKQRKKRAHKRSLRRSNTNG